MNQKIPTSLFPTKQRAIVWQEIEEKQKEKCIDKLSEIQAQGIRRKKRRERKEKFK